MGQLVPKSLRISHKPLDAASMPPRSRVLRKQVAASFALSIVCLFAGAQSSSSLLAKDTRPNILFIMSDDHGYQAIGAYGSKVNQTPNLDRIAKEGMRFDRCFVTNSICGPAVPARTVPER